MTLIENISISVQIAGSSIVFSLYRYTFEFEPSYLLSLLFNFDIDSNWALLATTATVSCGQSYKHFYNRRLQL